MTSRNLRYLCDMYAASKCDTDRAEILSKIRACETAEQEHHNNTVAACVTKSAEFAKRLEADRSRAIAYMEARRITVPKGTLDNL